MYLNANQLLKSKNKILHDIFEVFFLEFNRFDIFKADIYLIKLFRD